MAQVNNSPRGLKRRGRRWHKQNCMILFLQPSTIKVVLAFLWSWFPGLVYLVGLGLENSFPWIPLMDRNFLRISDLNLPPCTGYILAMFYMLRDAIIELSLHATWNIYPRIFSHSLISRNTIELSRAVGVLKRTPVLPFFFLSADLLGALNMAEEEHAFNRAFGFFSWVEVN